VSHRSIGVPEWAAFRYLPLPPPGTRVWVTRTGNAIHLRPDCLVLRRYATSEGVILDRQPTMPTAYGVAWGRARTSDGRVRSVKSCRACGHDPFLADADTREAAALERLLQRRKP
jgi:hypothetical protein